MLDGRRETAWLELGEHAVFSDVSITLAGCCFERSCVLLHPHWGKRQKSGTRQKRVRTCVAHTALLCRHLRNCPLQIRSLQIQTLIENLLPPRLHNSTFPIKKYNTGFFRQSFDEFIRGTDCFTVFGSQQNCERDSPGFLCRKWEGGEEEVALRCSLVLCTASLMCVTTRTPSCLCERTPGTSVSASPLIAQIDTGLGILIFHFQ